MTTEDRKENRPTAPTETGRLRAIANPGNYDYLVSMPDAHAAAPERRWPLLLFLHGVAERGSNVWDVVRQGPPKLLASGVELSEPERRAAAVLASSFILVAPQCPPHTVWNDDALLRLLDDVGRTFPVDHRRVCLTGLSMGGFGAWSLGIRHAARFSALAPVCGGGRLADIATAVRTEPEALRRLAVWAFHGARDIAVPLDESARMIDALRAAGVSEVKFTVYPEGEHDAWTAAYADPGLYPWLLGAGRQPK